MSETVTFNGVQVPVADVLKAAERIKAKPVERWLGIPAVAEPKAVEPGLYRWRDTTDADPFVGGCNIRRKNADGAWEYLEEWDGQWKRVRREHRFIDEKYVRLGSLVPLQPVEGVEYEGGDVYGYRRRWRNNRWESTWRNSLHCWGVSPSAYFWRTGQLRPIVQGAK